MSKAKIARDGQGRFRGITYNCPCGQCGTTTLPVRWLPPGETEESPHVKTYPHWGFNGDLEKPVFTPSVLSSWEGGGRKHVCHSFIGINGAQPGQIKYLADCTHALVNQTVELPDIEN